MLVTLGPGALISDLNILLIHENNYNFGHIYKLFAHIIVRNRWPRSDNNRDTQREWLLCEGYVYSRSVNALLRCSIERNTLIASSSLEAPQPRAGRTKDVVQVLLVSTHDYIGIHAYGILVLDDFILFICKCPCRIYFMNYLTHAAP